MPSCNPYLSLKDVTMSRISFDMYFKFSGVHIENLRVLQSLPIQPGRQSQMPVSGSQLAPLPQSHILLQEGPYLPAGQAGKGQKDKQILRITVSSSRTGRNYTENMLKTLKAW